MRRRLTIFFTLIGLFTIYTGLHAQAFWPMHPAAGWTAIVALVGLIVFWQRIHRADESDPDSLRYRTLAWTGTIAMGIWATFLFFCLAADGVGLVVVIIRWFQPRVLSGVMTGRQGPVALLLLSVTFAVFGLVQAVRGPRVVHVKIPINNLPEALVGFKIALISDLHVGPTIRERYVRDVVDQTLALHADVIAVTGDLGDESVHRVRDQTAPLGRLTAPFGTYYITGNHEYYWNAPEWLAQAREFGWVPLVNENRTLDVKGKSVFVAGITDSQGAMLAGHTPDIERAADGIEKADFRLLLSHRPGVYAAAERLGFHLQLSGHTHGGQFFPWSLVIPFVHRYYKDLNRFRRLWIYVSPGTGYWGPPHRFLVPSEITLLELTSSRARYAAAD